MRIPLFRAMVLTLALFVPIAVPAAEEILIGTGHAAGTNHALGRAICRLVNLQKSGLKCRAIPTTGPLFNLSAVRDGALEFAIVSSEWQFHAQHQSGPFRYTDGNFDNLRALFSAHPTSLTLVATRDTGITELDDLRNGRVNIGNSGSLERATMNMLMTARGWNKKNFSLAEELPAGQQSLSLCHKKIQVATYVRAHPDRGVMKTLRLCDAHLVNVSGSAINGLLEAHPWLTATEIPQGTYGPASRAVHSFGTRATLITSSEINTGTAEALVAATFSNLRRLRKMHPAFRQLDASTMEKDTLSAPLHEGAQHYFQQHHIR